MTKKSVPTGAAARLIGVTAHLLRQWNARGHLKLAPRGKYGAGGHELMWSPEAISEAIEWAERPRRGRKRT